MAVTASAATSSIGTAGGIGAPTCTSSISVTKATSSPRQHEEGSITRRARSPRRHGATRRAIGERVIGGTLAVLGVLTATAASAAGQQHLVALARPVALPATSNIYFVLDTGAGFQVVANGAKLFESTDLSHWRDISPPARELVQDKVLPFVTEVSFASPTTGLVSTYNPASSDQTMLRTTTGGRTWTMLSRGFQSLHVWSWLDLVSERFAVTSGRYDNANSSWIETSDDGGKTWSKVYGTSPHATGDAPVAGYPVEFLDSRTGFAADGMLSFAGGDGVGNFFVTTDGAKHWKREHPPLPTGRLRCPPKLPPGPPSGCFYGLPFFSDRSDAVLPAAVESQYRSEVAFDVTSDGGARWMRVSQRDANALPLPNGNRSGRPLVSIVSGDCWWVIGWHGHRVTAQVTADAGRHWRSGTSTISSQRDPQAFAALSASKGLLAIERDNAWSTSFELLVTNDGGLTWRPERLAA